jgi:protein gp37
MAETSAIEWTDATWNIVTGCSVVSPACTNCYAMRLAGTRLKHHPSRAGLTREVNGKPVWTGEVRFNDEWLPDPMKWKRPRKIFVAAHGDLFHDAVPDAWIDRVFAIMALAHWHTFQVLTKRSARMRAYLSAPGVRDRIVSTAQALERAGKVRACFFAFPWPLSNIWLGVTVEDQQRADERIPDLLATPAAVRFVSCEPLLGGIDFRHISLGESGDTLDALYPGVAHRRGLHNEYRPRESSHAGLDLVIAGGESGPAARPSHPDWFRSLRDQCAAAGVPFFMKQLHVGGKLVKDIGAFPENLRVRELPHCAARPRLRHPRPPRDKKSDAELSRWLTTEEAFEHMKKRRPDIFGAMTFGDFELWLEERVARGDISPPKCFRYH